ELPAKITMLPKLLSLGGLSGCPCCPPAIRWTAGLAVDADGCPSAYAPDDSGLDHLANAGHPGNWWGLVTDNGRPDGEPLKQTATDPQPGFYISTTALVDPTRHMVDPGRYVDAAKVPYLSLPPEIFSQCGAHLGDVAVVDYGGNRCGAVVADVGPAG